jgi:hypothetical protein
MRLKESIRNNQMVQIQENQRKRKLKEMEEEKNRQEQQKLIDEDLKLRYLDILLGKKGLV